MRRFKRNQVDEALEAVFVDRQPETVSVRTRVKRLLNTDNALALARRGERYAFSTKGGAGSGVEIWFSEYEVFALFAGLCFLSLHWPQQTAVRIMRHARATLEQEFERVSFLGPSELETGPTVALRHRSPGSPVLMSSDPRFLVVFSSGWAASDLNKLAPDSVHLCESEYSLTVLRKTKFEDGLSSMSVIEVTSVIRSLAMELDRSKPKLRGRKAS